jgi:hypothetical protein
MERQPTIHVVAATRRAHFRAPRYEPVLPVSEPPRSAEIRVSVDPSSRFFDSPNRAEDGIEIRWDDPRAGWITEEGLVIAAVHVGSSDAPKFVIVTV